MQSDLSKLAKNLWNELSLTIANGFESEAAQRIVDIFVEAGCEDIDECVKLVDAARASVLDDEINLTMYEED